MSKHNRHGSQSSIKQSRNLRDSSSTKGSLRPTSLLFIGTGIFLFIIVTIYIDHTFFHENITRFNDNNIEPLLSKLEGEQSSLKMMIHEIELTDRKIDYKTPSIPNGTIQEHKIIKASPKSSDIEAPNGNPIQIMDVGKKKYFPDAITFSSAHQSVSDNSDVLIVGGTDGSGTRRVVQILTELGVTMVSEDPETYDIHADLIGGWPPIVNSVLWETHSLNYNPRKLSSSLYVKTKQSLIQLLKQAESDTYKPTSYKLAVGGTLNKPGIANSLGIKYGFKAPVSMTLSPWWAEVLPNFKFLHVLRDGRDIAFSVNQGPVEKFYRMMYVGKNEQPPLRAIRLWSDWNSQIYEWAKQHSSSNDSSNVSKSFGYFALHSEDLISDDRNIKFSAIYNLAKWVKSNLTDDELCCVAVKGSAFMGSHDRAQGLNENQVASRYGKWKKIVQGDGTLNQKLHEIGGEGLRLFGYEPLREFAGDNSTTANGYQCTFAESHCRYNIRTLQKSLGDINKWGASGKCTIYEGVDFKGGAVVLTVQNATQKYIFSSVRGNIP